MFILPGGGVGGVGLVHKIAAVVVMVGWSCFVGIFYIIENFSHFIFKPKSSFMLLSAHVLISFSSNGQMDLPLPYRYVID